MKILSDITTGNNKNLILHNNIRSNKEWLDSQFTNLVVLIDLNKQTIDIEGFCNDYRQESFKRQFKVGDVVKTGSYNYVYTANITKITKKSIQTDSDLGSTIKTFNLVNFIYHNWNLDLDKIDKRNIEVSYTI